jgi:hypothetical protein
LTGGAVRAVGSSATSWRHVEGILEFVDAGYDRVYFHQVGPDQEGFLRFAEAELLPRLEDARD